MVVADLIRRGAIYYGSKIAVEYQGQRLSFEDVYQHSRRLAQGLLRAGLRPGDRVAFLLANSVKSIEIDFALLMAGLVRVPLNTRLSLEEHFHMIHETEARALLFSEEFYRRMTELRETVPNVICCQVDGMVDDPEVISLAELTNGVSDDEPSIRIRGSDLATIQYTSGTTGVLKAAVHTQDTWIAICNNILSCLDIRAGDIMLHVAPLTHASGTLVLPHWVQGATNAVLPNFNPLVYLETVAAVGATTLNVVPTMIVMLLEAPNVESYSFDTVRQIIYGASPIPQETLKRGLQLWGAKFIQYYGQTEAPLILTLLSKEDHVRDSSEETRLLSCGRPVPTAVVEVWNDAGEQVPPGTIGEICVNSTQAMIGYWKDPELTKETLKEGWIHTRDMGYVDKDGYVFLVDRRSDMIISGGFNVYPREVEDVLCQHPAVIQAAVVGVPDEKWVETVKAFVITRSGFTVTESELIQFCKERLASYKKPSSVEFVKELPMNSVGKVVRRLLRDPYWDTKDRPI